MASTRSTVRPCTTGPSPTANGPSEASSRRPADRRFDGTVKSRAAKNRATRSRAVGAYAWWQDLVVRGFWPLLRLGQALVAVTAVQGTVLQLAGEPLPRLHLVYGLVPLAVSFVAEQLRIASAQTVLDQRGLQGSDAVRALPEHEQRAIVRDIVARETGVMAASALVVAFLGVRAGGWL